MAGQGEYTEVQFDIEQGLKGSWLAMIEREGFYLGVRLQSQPVTVIGDQVQVHAVRLHVETYVEELHVAMLRGWYSTSPVHGG